MGSAFKDELPELLLCLLGTGEASRLGEIGVSGEHVGHAKSGVGVFLLLMHPLTDMHQGLHDTGIPVVRIVLAELSGSVLVPIEPLDEIVRLLGNIRVVLWIEVLTTASIPSVLGDMSGKVSQSVLRVSEDVHQHRVSLDKLLDLDNSFLVVLDALSVEVAGLEVVAAEQDEHVKACPDLNRLYLSDLRVVVSKFSSVFLPH